LYTPSHILGYAAALLFARGGTDGLTGLLNRRAFDELLTRELQRADEEGRCLPVMLVDVHCFNVADGTRRHRAGDAALRKIGDALRESLRAADLLSRYRTEVFAILLRGTKLSAAAEVAGRLRKAAASIADLPDGMWITIGIGIAGSIPGEKAEELMSRCDRALQQATRDGGNRVSMAAAMWVEEPAVIQPSPRREHRRETRRSA
jgi:diguanylate cyclase (GGDEF)-like protein